MAKYLRPRRGSQANARSQNIKLQKGELFMEFPNGYIGKEPGRIVVGCDGTTTYSALNHSSIAQPALNTYQPFITDPSIYIPKFTNTATSTGSGSVTSAMSEINNIGDGSTASTKTLPNIIGSIKKSLIYHDNSITKLNNDLAGKAASDHNHDSRYYTSTQVKENHYPYAIRVGYNYIALPNAGLCYPLYTHYVTSGSSTFTTNYAVGYDVSRGYMSTESVPSANFMLNDHDFYSPGGWLIGVKIKQGTYLIHTKYIPVSNATSARVSAIGVNVHTTYYSPTHSYAGIHNTLARTYVTYDTVQDFTIYKANSDALLVPIGRNEGGNYQIDSSTVAESIGSIEMTVIRLSANDNI